MAVQKDGENRRQHITVISKEVIVKIAFKEDAKEVKETKEDKVEALLGQGRGKRC